MRLIKFLGFLVAISLFWPSLVVSQICSGCKIQPVSLRTTRLANAEAALVTAASEQAILRDRHLPFGFHTAPAGATNEHALYQQEWITWYDDDLRNPMWVAYELTAAQADAQRPRLDCFRHDSRLVVDAMSGCNDFKTSGFDRGHLAPADDLKRAETSIDNSFLLSNMHPQFPKFNQNVWRRLESKVNTWAIESGSINIITGAIFDRNGDGQRDEDSVAVTFSPNNRVSLATHFYKIILHRRPNGKIDTISFVLPHNNKTNSKDSYYKSKITSIDKIEELTGIDFFPDMESSQEENIEAGKATSLGLWFTF